VSNAALPYLPFYLSCLLFYLFVLYLDWYLTLMRIPTFMLRLAMPGEPSGFNYSLPFFLTGSVLVSFCHHCHIPHKGKVITTIRHVLFVPNYLWYPILTTQINKYQARDAASNSAGSVSRTGKPSSRPAGSTATLTDRNARFTRTGYRRR